MFAVAAQAQDCTSVGIRLRILKKHSKHPPRRTPRQLYYPRKVNPNFSRPSVCVTPMRRNTPTHLPPPTPPPPLLNSARRRGRVGGRGACEAPPAVTRGVRTPEFPHPEFDIHRLQRSSYEGNSRKASGECRER